MQFSSFTLGVIEWIIFNKKYLRSGDSLSFASFKTRITRRHTHLFRVHFIYRLSRLELSLNKLRKTNNEIITTTRELFTPVLYQCIYLFKCPRSQPCKSCYTNLISTTTIIIIIFLKKIKSLPQNLIWNPIYCVYLGENC